MKNLFEHFIWMLFPIFQRLGIHVLPVSYNTPVPDTSLLHPTDPIFSKMHPMTGIDQNIKGQLKVVKEVVKQYQEEYASAGGDQFGFDESKMRSYAPFNALVLYSFVRHFKPKKMIEVGSGMSTRISASALARNAAERKGGEFIAIEPYPSRDLKLGIDGLSSLIEKRVQDVPLEVFTSLRKNDILFIDSTHTVKIGGDVNYLFLEVLPHLSPGVIVHVHDIFLPYEYPPHHFAARKIGQFWQEQYLLHAFLMFNDQFKIVLNSSFLHKQQLALLKREFPWYHQNRWPSSFWMTRI